METGASGIGIDELQAKYQRLGQEYQKARAQITVLKKAVLDEQGATKVIQDGLKQRDQTIRKYEQEIDSLHFRNSQLSKRVEILQTELGKYESKGVKPGKQPSTQQTSISFIHEQELQMKIAENASLHKQLQEASVEHSARVYQLESRLETFEKNKQDYEKLLEESNSENSVIIQKLKEEQHLLDAKLIKQTEDLKLANIMAEKYKNQFKENTTKLQSKLENTTKMMQEKMPFIDSQVSEYNKLNVPVSDKSYNRKTQIIIESVTNQFIAFLGSLSDYHTYLEQRLQVFSTDIKQENISAINEKFSTHLLKNAVYSRKLQHSLKYLHEQSLTEIFVMTDTLTSLKDVSCALQKYCNYLSVLMPYRVISIEEECRSALWSESIERCNNDILNEEKNVLRIFSKLASYSKVLTTPDVPTSSQGICIKKICENFSYLNDCFKNLCKLYVAKSGDEQDLPTYTDRLKTTDDFLLSTLNSLESSSSKMFNVLHEHLSFLCTPHLYKRKGLPWDTDQTLPYQINKFNNKASHYISSLLKPVSQSVPYDLVVQNNRSLFTGSSSDNDLSKQIIESQNKISMLEQEKEHWILEHKLLKAKYDKELKKAAMVGEELKKAKNETISRPCIDSMSDLTPQDDMQSNEPILSPSESAISVLGTLEVVNRDKSGSIDSDQETLVKEYLSNRINELTKQLQVSDSKCVNFYQEAHSLYNHLLLADKNKQKLSKALSDSTKRVEELQDELETTKRSYEEQLGMFSDHLMGMNDKLTSQKDQIDELKTSGSATGSSSSHNFGIFQLPGRKK